MTRGRGSKRIAIGMGMLERTPKKKEKKGEEAAAKEVIRANWQRMAATTAWTRSQPRRWYIPTWNLTLWSSRHGPDISAGT